MKMMEQKGEAEPVAAGYRGGQRTPVWHWDSPSGTHSSAQRWTPADPHQSPAVPTKLWSPFHTESPNTSLLKGEAFQHMVKISGKPTIRRIFWLCFSSHQLFPSPPTGLSVTQRTITVCLLLAGTEGWCTETLRLVSPVQPLGLTPLHWECRDSADPSSAINPPETGQCWSHVCGIAYFPLTELSTVCYFSSEYENFPMNGKSKIHGYGIHWKFGLMFPSILSI